MTTRGDTPIFIEGPWSHRSVSANGTRFHVAESGDGPLVLLLHGFPEFWWTWRTQLSSLSAAGFRAVAVDLRGYGGSDKPPRGYDLVTAASDAAGLVRSLGEANAVIVGHDWGGLIAWTVAAYFPKVVRRLAVVSVPHPLRLRSAVLSDPLGQGRRSGYALRFQLPLLPERQLVKDDALRVGRMLGAWSGPGWPDFDTERNYRSAMCIPSVAHSALEYHRWFVRSRLRPDGLRYARSMRAPIQAPTLHLHGSLDSCMLPSAARGWQARRGAVPVAAHRWRRALPARGAARAFRHRAARVARRPGARAMRTPPPDGERQKRAAQNGAATRTRDRDATGRPRNARPRDQLGRPLRRDASGKPAVPDGPALPPDAALDLAQELIDSGLAFRAHEVLEASWKAAPAHERELWKGLAQVMVGLTHAQRGNATGAVVLLRRGGRRVAEYAHRRRMGSARRRSPALRLSLPTGSSGTGSPPPRATLRVSLRTAR